MTSPSKRFSFWVIVAGALPTAFRARNAEDLLPTLRQLQRTQPSAELRWYERGRFWESKEAAIADARQKRRTTAARKPAWRPGGTHEDPKARFKRTREQKRAQFKSRLIRDKTSPKPPSRRAGRPKPLKRSR